MNENELQLQRIEKFVNSSLGIKINQITRERPIVYGRDLFYALAKKCTDLTLAKIGLFFGKEGEYLTKDHATVLHGIKVFNNVLLLEKKYKDLYNSYIFKYLEDLYKKDVITEFTNQNVHELVEYKEQALTKLNKTIVTLEQKNINLKDKIEMLIKEIKVSKNYSKKLNKNEIAFRELSEEKQARVSLRMEAIIRMENAKDRNKTCVSFGSWSTLRA